MPEDPDNPFNMLDEEGERLAAMIRGGGPPPEHRPLPESWQKLIDVVNLATVEHRLDPTRPLYKIGRFDAVIHRGDGGNGFVFEAIDPDLLCRVALKLCPGHTDAAADAVLAEARKLASLKHPNVIAVHEVGRHDDYVFFVMDFATGKTAHHYARTKRPWRDILDVYLGAGAGLAAAHEHEHPIIHGDFKPSNVLLDHGGTWPRVADFGIARVRLADAPASMREELLARGTPGFVAPEVLRGQPYDERSDQWSFCASLWHSLEGTLPFDAPTTDRMLDMIERTEPQRRNPAVPEALRMVLERGLSLDPRDRFASMRDLLRMLELVRQTAVTPAPMSADEELAVTVRRQRRRRGPGWGFSVVCLVTAGVSVFAAVRNAPPRALEPTAVVSECAVEPGESLSEDAELRQATVDVCRMIRAGEFLQADIDWDEQWSPGDAEVAEATLIVARTFVEAAESIGDRDPGRAGIAAKTAKKWARMLGDGYVGVADIRNRAAAFDRD